MNKKRVALTIGGSDSCGGAGVQADLRTFAASAVAGCSAITALTAQHPGRVLRIEPVSLAQLDAEIHAIFDYYDVAVVKTGMLYDAGRVALISGLLETLHDGPLVVDPVMISSSGTHLLDCGGIDAMVHALLPKATLITPNLDEAALLLGSEVGDVDAAATALAERFATAVLLKGGHGSGDELIDLLCDADGSLHHFRHARQPWSEDQAHGTGCRLASAVAANLLLGMVMKQAVEAAVSSLQSG